MADGVYPISMIYLGCVQALCQINLERTRRSNSDGDPGMGEGARADKFMEPFIEYHGLLQGTMEVCIRKKSRKCTRSWWMVYLHLAVAG